MITLIFGDEKSAKPRPSVTKTTITKEMVVAASIVAATPRPVAHSPMPIVATAGAEKRSARRPQSGEKIACTIGCMIRMVPASRGLSPLTNCRYRLRKKVTPKVAA